ncbi:MAG TPA: VOC family protein [Ktedonobacterales bacterium]|nr:VOC family protein [Ktedonobacterales bacterium]
MLTGLNFAILHVRDMAQMRAYYTEKLGLNSEGGSPEFVQFNRPGEQGATFALQADANAQPKADPELWWYVDDADAVHAELVRRGVEIASAPKDEPFGRAFSIKDPEGNTLYMLQLR